MGESRIALKPYLQTIAGYCDTLSKEELTDIIISLAKDVPTSGRVGFLQRVESCLPGRRTAIMPEPGEVEQILNDIQALRESIKERISSIEDGTYWEDTDDWGDDEYYDDDPDYIGEDQVEELGAFLGDAESLFMNDRLEDARKVYEALFSLINEIKEDAYLSPGPEGDIRESRARYCRCVYETSDSDKRLDEFVEAMEVDLFDPYNEDEYNDEYPMMQDVIDAKPGEMEDIESFLLGWKKVLASSETRARSAVLLLEAVNRLEGIKGVSKLAKKWKNTHPQGYLFWLDILRKEKDQKGVIRVSTEALKALKEGRFRERVAEFVIDAAEKLNDAKQLLIGKRERLFSYVSDQNLLDFVCEATKQDARDKEVQKAINFFKARESLDEEGLYVKTLLVSGKLASAVSMVKNEKSVGWSHGSSAGVVFGSVLSVLAGHSAKAGAIKTLLKSYANSVSVYSGRFSINESTSASFYDEIVEGLKQKKNTKSEAAKSFSWAERIGKKRIDHIVSNKYRGAYERAAQVLGCLGEAYMAMDKKGNAEEILHKYYNEKYNRFSAFRREVKAVVTASDLLRNAGFLK